MIDMLTSAQDLRIWLMNAPRRVAIDTETTLIRDRKIPQLLVVSVATSDRGAVLPVRGTEAQLAAVGAISRWLPFGEAIFHNAVFDLEVIAKVGMTREEVASAVRAGKVHDTMILDQLLRLAEGGEGAERGSRYYHKVYDGTLPRRSLKVLAEELLGLTLEKGDVRTSFESLLTTGMLTREQLEYAGMDAIATARVGEILIARAASYGPELLTESTQILGGLALSAIGRRGLRLDSERTTARQQAEIEAKARAAEVLRERGFLTTVGKKTPREKLSEKTLRAALIDIAAERQVPLTWTPKGQVSLSREDWDQYKDADPVIGALVEYKKREKRLGTFLRKWLDAARADGCIRPTYRPLIATGRTSCHNPNLQQVPKRQGGLTQLFCADPGARLWELDYRTLELVCVAQVCLTELGESHLAVVLNAGTDVHTWFAKRIYGKAEVTKDERFIAKMANFGFWGGMGWRTFKRHLWTLARLDLPDVECERLREEWLAAFPEARDWLRLVPPSGIIKRAKADVPIGEWDAEQALAGRQTRLTESQIDLLVEAILKRAEAFHLTDSWAAGARVREALEKRQFRGAVLDWLAWRETRTLTGRRRRPVGYSEWLNTAFQGLAADGCKLALGRLWVTGFDVRAYVHDSVLLQVPEGLDEQADVAARIMCDEMRTVVPDMVVRVEVVGPMTHWGEGGEAHVVEWKGDVC